MYCTWESIDTDHTPQTTMTTNNTLLIFLITTSREGLRQVNDDMYKFLLVTNFGGH